MPDARVYSFRYREARISKDWGEEYIIICRTILYLPPCPDFICFDAMRSRGLLSRASECSLRSTFLDAFASGGLLFASLGKFSALDMFFHDTARREQQGNGNVNKNQ